MAPSPCAPPPQGKRIDPYQVVALCPAVHGISRRADVIDNIERIDRLIRTALWTANLELPTRLVAVPEGALQGFADEIHDTGHADYARHCAIDIPGPETDRLAAICIRHDLYLMATAKARNPAFPDRYFNIGFLIGPDGRILLRHHKLSVLHPHEASLTPHAVWDKWIELYGQTLDSFYPVADTEIGRIGFMIANEAAYPENARGLALNGCEIAYRGPYPIAEFASIQNRARALDNNMYVIGNQNGPTIPDGHDNRADPIDKRRHSMVVDYRGQIIASIEHSGTSTFLSATIDVEALRDYRLRTSLGGWLKDLTTEQYRIIYETPIFPRNIYTGQIPGTVRQRRDILQRQIQLLVERGTWRHPGWTSEIVHKKRLGRDHGKHQLHAADSRPAHSLRPFRRGRRRAHRRWLSRPKPA